MATAIGRTPERRKLGVAILVYNIDSFGGMERQAARLAERLAARGVRVVILSTFFPPGWGVPLPARPRAYEVRNGVEILRVPFFAWWTYEACLELYDAVVTYALMRRRHRIDVLYAVQFTGAFHAAHASGITGMPTLVKFACSGEHGDFHVMRGYHGSTAIRAALRTIDRYVCIAEGVRKEAEEEGLDPRRFVMVPNGVDLARFSRPLAPAELPELGPAASRRVVLFVGRHDHQKRIDVLLRAFAEVHERIPEARLACAGTGPLVGELEALARTLGVAGEVAFLGARPDVDALHRAASVFVLPSASEGMPNALLEALAAGTPSVATDIPGTNEVARHEREALLVPVDDAPALARAITRLLEDPALAARLSAAGRTRVAQEYDIERVTDRYVALFRETARDATRTLSCSRLVRLYAHFGWIGIRFAGLVLGGVARAAITSVVVRTKKLFGIERELLSVFRKSG